MFRKGCSTENRCSRTMKMQQEHSVAPLHEQRAPAYAEALRHKLSRQQEREFQSTIHKHNETYATEMATRATAATIQGEHEVPITDNNSKLWVHFSQVDRSWQKQGSYQQDPVSFVEQTKIGNFTDLRGLDQNQVAAQVYNAQTSASASYPQNRQSCGGLQVQSADRASKKQDGLPTARYRKS